MYLVEGIIVMRIASGFGPIPFVATVLLVALGDRAGQLAGRGARREDGDRSTQLDAAQRDGAAGARRPPAPSRRRSNYRRVQVTRRVRRRLAGRSWTTARMQGRAGFYLVMPFKIAGSRRARAGGARLAAARHRPTHDRLPRVRHAGRHGDDRRRRRAAARPR